MSARVSSGVESKQDYQTPDDFMASISKRFGPISFDLAAHADNKKHARYFAPAYFKKRLEFRWKLEEEETQKDKGVTIELVRRTKTGRFVYEERTPNKDKKAYGIDAFAHEWSPLTKKFKQKNETGILFLNPEFDDISTWSMRCLQESKKGAEILMLTPLTSADWYRDFIAGWADVYQLSGRLMFDGENVFPKDCMLTHYRPRLLLEERRKGSIYLWDWRDDVICGSWLKKMAA